ncbi:MAG: tRNA (adenosine(37)-N6)-threonylcarbamoyltransferase complex ATPase subunit type 1 TsaE [Burkholderiales bacterium]|nr:tRNA (adenosine(37)-N6)-threonylcarbamoyltransferase complex ATPase subunit type 1 TsaE [Burkholderiales bacterium]
MGAPASRFARQKSHGEHRGTAIQFAAASASLWQGISVAFHHNRPVPNLTRYLPAEADTLALGAMLAPGLTGGMIVALTGELGSGKTTLVRGILRAMGHAGRVKSPTFTVVEPYELSRLYFYHFDFYRFTDPSELNDAGLEECFNPDAVCLIEWPEKAAGTLPPADLEIELTVPGPGRQAVLRSGSEAGERCLERLRQ